MQPHCSNMPICANAHMGPTRSPISFIETLGEERGSAPNTKAIRIAA